MRSAHNVNVVREAERRLMDRLPEGTLMRRAATGLAIHCSRMLPRVYGSRVTLLVGGGDNGGDALYAGANLAARGAFVRAVAAGRRIHEDGAAALRARGGRILSGASEDGPTDQVRAALFDTDVIVDGLVGIGGRGGLRGPHAALATLATNSPAPVVAVDLPSGVDAQTGEVAGHAVRAEATVTFGTYKPGLFVDPGAERAGRVHFVDIGLGPELPGADLHRPGAVDIARLLPGLGAEADKYRRGVLAVRAGSDRYPGAAVLCVGGALRTGVGMVRYGGGEEVLSQVIAHWPETVGARLDLEGDDLSPGRVAAVVVGSGRGTEPANADELRAVLESDRPVLLDADAITLLGADEGLAALLPERSGHTLLTPHAGELSRLLPDSDRADIEARRLEHVTRAAELYRATVLLKGSTTLIAHPDAPTVANPTGTPLLATAGSGDVLSGAAGALLAAGLPPQEAAMCAAYLHGRAAELVRAGAPISASDLLEGLPLALREVRASEGAWRGATGS
ncbi:bifunctional ADP-dependent NAD(P)H-hydrate dehydratase/NAD(P)H-hydrate epimerase [Nocardiopsis alkaliphila]|uniref:bifunctional ADP-dependent NAD(P)H-hydrate dehydratase/NAD(P)H-hydrate epimerase n=1 Tax=Nocardiopsis alkaliphila TaxID=225762 RepID=UPI000477115E|nr:bifunctional ADP-dependent NAD(P)H-hydrate dehydratase/NAD(P)H-hydrate epimerase [Nocardiopsis alkaliphila]